MKTGAEAIRALATQLPAFRQKLSDGWYQVRIAAPAAPSRIELTPGYFQITATPHLAVYDPTVQFEFW
ncbi:fibronectin type III family protein, partial [Escherichia coli]|nr:fibronectin type III family protein [Escherichia coli]